MVDQIFKAPDIRKQTLEQAESFIEEKRVRRMILAAQHQKTVEEKATKLHEINALKFERQNTMFNNQMIRLEALIEKMDERLEKMAEINSEMVNLEGVIADERS